MGAKAWVMAITAAGVLALSGCDANDGPAEKAGAKVDNAIDSAGEKVEQAGDKIQDSVNK